MLNKETKDTTTKYDALNKHDKDIDDVTVQLGKLDYYNLPMERMAELDSICGSFEEPEQSEPNFETIELRNHHLTPTSLFLWCLVILSASGLVQPESHRILRSVHCFVLLLCCTFRYTVAGTLMPSPLLARRVRVRQAPQLAPPPRARWLLPVVQPSPQPRRRGWSRTCGCR